MDRANFYCMTVALNDNVALEIVLNLKKIFEAL